MRSRIFSGLVVLAAVAAAAPSCGTRVVPDRGQLSVLGRSLMLEVGSLSDGCKSGEVDVSTRRTADTLEVRIPSYTVRDASAPGAMCTLAVVPVMAGVTLEEDWLKNGAHPKTLVIVLGGTENTFLLDVQGDVVQIEARALANVRQAPASAAPAY